MTLPAPEVVRPSYWNPIVWGLVALFVTCAGLGGLGLAISASESAGVSAAMIVAFPLGFVWGGAIAAIALQFISRATTPVRIGAPFGCGCLGGAAAAGLMIVFFAALWPAL